MTGGRETLIDYAAAVAPSSPSPGSPPTEQTLLVCPRRIASTPFFLVFLRLLRGPVQRRRNEAELRWTFGDWFFFVVVREVEECQESPQRMQGLSGQTLSLSLSLFFPARLHCLPLCFSQSERRRAAKRWCARTRRGRSAAPLMCQLMSVVWVSNETAGLCHPIAIFLLKLSSEHETRSSPITKGRIHSVKWLLKVLVKLS